MLLSTSIIESSVIILIILHTSIMTNGEVNLFVKTTPQFPHPVDKPFDMKITSSTINETIDGSYTDLLLVRVIDPSGMTLEKSIFDYGMKDKIDREFIGQFIRIPTWQVSRDRRSINLSIRFSNLSNNKILEIYKINVSSKTIRHHILDNLRSGKMIYRHKINIFVPPKLKMSVNGIDGNRNVFTKGEVVIVTCQVVEAIPKRIPIFTNMGNFTVKASSFNVERNEREVMILLSISDHGKTLICCVGKVNISMGFKIFHHPMSVMVNPDVRGVVTNDIIVKCGHRGGYPLPKVQWSFIEGPANASKYYNISSDGQHLLVERNSISDHPWKFNCSVTSSFLNSIKISHKTISFIVQEKPRNPAQDFNKIILYVNEMKRLTNKYETLFKKIHDVKENNRNLENRLENIFGQINKSSENNKNEITLLKHRSQIQNYGEFIWKVGNFSKTVKHGKKQQSSDVFYTHRNGYKLCLSLPSIGVFGVYANLALYFHILRGEFDDILPWPMNQTISIGIINQETKSEMLTRRFSYDRTSALHQFVFNRPTSYSNHGLGNTQFVIIDDLLNNPSLCKNDVVYIRCSVTRL